ncbi:MULTISPECIES: tryptophan halogenase family protein [unclassified Pseudoalteromonas]|uniref:tryptophan halogenase family protein n=1 Tax=unclassified Pseudoalteromonas TaxID=194690 RepID=UPI0020975BC8|nr:tryptophan halogenase family protein [Pseudoalteromonas sp. XMcav2-N]MCO7188416.1 tryptophan 7-halogenase [Pseudoalteromonas sp. XMcav2-N]
MSKPVNNLVIVGGGTAGWLTAAVLASQLNSKKNNAVQVTLVESPEVPILGVGEGTWPNLRATLRKIGVSEADFMRECDATFKQGALFVNWMTADNGEQHQYYHPLNTVYHSSYEFSLAPYWLLGHGQKQRYDHAVATQSQVCDAGLGPKEKTTPEYQAIQEYSYHLNANKFADFLTRHCTEKLGVKHLLAHIKGAQQDAEGFVTALETDNEQHPLVEGDLFVDCSGSKPILFEKTFNIPWKDISDVIFNDMAIAMQVPYSDPDRPIASHTIMTAQDNGWIWDIGLYNRRGVGHVFSSRYTTAEKAEQQLRDYVGKEAEQLDARVIPLKLGYREKFWHKNCIAIGMSAGFVEPLEASAIYLYDGAANMLADQFPRTFEAMAYVEEKFNRSFTMRMEKTIDFIKLHYCISDRLDSQYWRDNCAPESIPKSLQSKLAHWSEHPPTRYDFENAWEPFNLDSYLYVLYGMNFNTDLSHNSDSFNNVNLASAKFAEVSKMADRLTTHLPKHRELLDKVYRFGFTKI